MSDVSCLVSHAAYHISEFTTRMSHVSGVISQCPFPSCHFAICILRISFVHVTCICCSFLMSELPFDIWYLPCLISLFTSVMAPKSYFIFHLTFVMCHVSFHCSFLIWTSQSWFSLFETSQNFLNLFWASQTLFQRILDKHVLWCPSVYNS